MFYFRFAFSNFTKANPIKIITHDIKGTIRNMAAVFEPMGLKTPVYPVTETSVRNMINKYSIILLLLRRNLNIAIRTIKNGDSTQIKKSAGRKIDAFL